MSKEVGEVTVGGRRVKVSSLGKVLFPETGFTKGDLIAYYVGVAKVLLPHLRGRALTLKRYPKGVDGAFFYEKNCPVHRPEWVETVWRESETGRRRDGRAKEGTEYCVVNSAAGLAWVANLGSIELHTSLATAKTPEVPRVMVFDLDPGPPAGLLEAVEVGLALREALAGVGLSSVAKVSGGKGFHVYVPLNTKVSFEETKAVSREVAGYLERKMPDRVVSVQRKAARVGKVLVDWSQNDSHKTTVCVYSVRARGVPTVSMPVSWEEARRAWKKGDEGALRFTAGGVLGRIEKVGDLFGEVLEGRQVLSIEK